MKRIKRLLCVILAIITVVSMSTVCITASAGSKKSAPKVEPLKVTVSTRKTEYSTLEGAIVTVKVHNISNKDLKNIVIYPTSNQLLGINWFGATKKTIKVLTAGDSEEFRFVVFISKKTVSDGNKWLRKAVHYQHCFIRPTSFQGYDVASGKLVSTDYNLLFGVWPATLTISAYYNVEENDYNSIFLKENKAGEVDEEDVADEEAKVDGGDADLG